jgi:hypothetical protein
LHETRETLTLAGAMHVVRDFESVSADDLECIFADQNSGKLGAAAGA